MSTRDESEYGIPDDKAGTLTIKMDSPVERLGTLADRLLLLERLFFAAANSTSADSIDTGDSALQCGYHLALQEYAGQTRLELELCRNMLVNESNARYMAEQKAGAR
jgi:hypothetical protein